MAKKSDNKVKKISAAAKPRSKSEFYNVIANNG